MNRYLKAVCTGIALFTIAEVVSACQVPVFRYALERWQPDRYRVTVVKNGPLTDTQQAVVKVLQQSLPGRTAPRVQVIDAATDRQSQPPAIRPDQLQNGRAMIVADYPPSSSVPEEQPACSAELTAEQARFLFRSPVRDEVARRLASGHSAVWIFVESGHTDQDEAALKILEEQLLQDNDWLKLPSPEELEVAPDVLNAVKVPLRIEFSVVRLKRGDVREQLLLDCLLNSESDLRTFDEPLAFPVFGRGRVLYALVGKGIAPDTIRTASSFIAGPCSCQVKSQNPGFDLPLQFDWDAAIGDTFISDPLPDAPSQPTLLTIPPGNKRQ